MRVIRWLTAVVLTLGLVRIVASEHPVSAVAGQTYASWTLGGSGGAYTGSMALALGFPTATFTSTSRAPASLPGGSSTWLPEGSPFGGVFGSSEGQSYLNLRPEVDSPSGPSVTTYTFASPTPASGWGFALGDIDADQVEISATDADGNPVAIAGLGFQGTFNYCDASPRSGACSGVSAPYDLPTWQPAATSGTLIGNDPADDTTGASGWFRPTASLSTLTFVYTQRSGFPVFQTWFASLTQSILGTVTEDATSPFAGVEVSVTGPDGTVLATTSTAADGTYSFPALLATDGYEVTVTVPDGFDPVGPTTLPADLSAGDATGVDFDLTTEPPPTTTTTTTTTTTSPPTTTTSPPTTTTSPPTTTTSPPTTTTSPPTTTTMPPTTTTSPPTTTTTTTTTVPPTSTTAPGTTTTTVPTYPVTGTVTDPDNNPVADADVAITDSSGTTLDSSTTDETGGFTLTDIPAGTYEISVDPPPAYLPTAVTVEVPLDAGETVEIRVQRADGSTTSTTPPGFLPPTGGSTAPMLVAALLAIGTGAATVLISRRTRSSQ